MAQATQPFKQSLSGSLGAGMKSVFGGGGRRFYTLVHKVSSKYHQAGESQRIIVDEIVLGRDPSCQVRFDESFSTVSRRHAAIVKDGDNWKLVQLSQTNSTYLNGHKVQKEWYLQNGDEIQLSTNGPKLGFIIPEGKKGMVSSINLTARLNLFRQQALRPYKTALWSIAAVLVAVLCVGGYFMSNTIKENRELDGLVKETIAEYEQYKSDVQKSMQELTEANDKLLADISSKTEDISKLKEKVEALEDNATLSVNASGINNEAVNACVPYVFYIQTVGYEIILPDGREGSLIAGEDGVPCYSGTGFLLDDGRFVTARHVVEPWAFWSDGSGEDDFSMTLNLIVNNGGKVVAEYFAVSSSGVQMQFTSEQFNYDRSEDEYYNDEEGNLLTLAFTGETDYAYMTNVTSTGLKYDSKKSMSLERGEQIIVLGFPMGLGANAIDDINPLYASCVVAASGLNDGMIISTDTNYEHGNSGGPVFCVNSDNSLSVVGIVSAGAGNNTGFIVPISAIN